MCHSRILSPSKASEPPTLFPLHLPRAEMFALRRSDENEPERKILPARSASRVQHRLLYIISGAPAARRAAKRSPIIIEKGTTRMHRNRNPCNSFLMVKMASGMDHGRVRPTATTTTSHNMAAIRLIPSHCLVSNREGLGTSL